MKEITHGDVQITMSKLSDVLIRQDQLLLNT